MVKRKLKLNPGYFSNWDYRSVNIAYKKHINEFEPLWILATIMFLLLEDLRGSTAQRTLDFRFTPLEILFDKFGTYFINIRVINPPAPPQREAKAGDTDEKPHQLILVIRAF